MIIYLANTCKTFISRFFDDLSIHPSIHQFINSSKFPFTRYLIHANKRTNVGSVKSRITCGTKNEKQTLPHDFHVLCYWFIRQIRRCTKKICTNKIVFILIHESHFDSYTSIFFAILSWNLIEIFSKKFINRWNFLMVIFFRWCDCRKHDRTEVDANTNDKGARWKLASDWSRHFHSARCQGTRVYARRAFDPDFSPIYTYLISMFFIFQPSII